LLLEVQSLDRVPRLGYAIRGVSDPESISEHCWHVLFLVWSLAERIPEIDRTRALEIAIVHDLAELRTGDIPMTASRYFPAGAKKAAEDAAIEEILAPLPARSRDLYAEFQAGKSAEARLVKACDKLQLMVKVSAYEAWGSTGLKEFWNNSENFPDGGFPAVRELYAELRRRRELRLGQANPESR
jgi:putative hydrolase of HD superfamily